MKFILHMSILTALFSCSQGGDNKNLLTNSGSGGVTQNNFSQMVFLGTPYGGGPVKESFIVQTGFARIYSRYGDGKPALSINFTEFSLDTDACSFVNQNSHLVSPENPRQRILIVSGIDLALNKSQKIAGNAIGTTPLNGANGTIYFFDINTDLAYWLSDATGQVSVLNRDDNYVTVKINDYKAAGLFMNGTATLKICK